MLYILLYVEKIYTTRYYISTTTFTIGVQNGQKAHNNEDIQHLQSST